MKTKQIINAVDDSFFTIAVTYQWSAEEEWNQPRKKKEYTFKVPKTVKIEENDLVILPGNNNYVDVAIGRVTKVHEEPDIDFDADFDYKWIVQKVDFDSYVYLVSRDTTFNQKIKTHEIQNKRDQVLAAFGVSREELLPLLEVKSQDNRD